MSDERKLWREASDILRRQGFTDIEPVIDGKLSEVGKAHRPQVARLADHEAVSFYYESARRFLLTYRFTSAIQRRVWELHSEAVSVKRIERVLRREGRRGRVRHEVQTIVVDLRQRMLNRQPRGRPPKPGGCHRDSARKTFRMQDGVAEGLAYLSKRWKLSEQEVIRRLVTEAARVS